MKRNTRPVLIQRYRDLSMWKHPVETLFVPGDRIRGNTDQLAVFLERCRKEWNKNAADGTMQGQEIHFSNLL